MPLFTTAIMNSKFFQTRGNQLSRELFFSGTCETNKGKAQGQDNIHTTNNNNNNNKKAG
jgi:hypothetical protein